MTTEERRRPLSLVVVKNRDVNQWWFSSERQISMVEA
jgi:hypothetical protein